MPTLTLSLNGATGKTNKWSDVSTPLNQVGTLLNTTLLDYLNIQTNGVRTGQVRSHAGVLQRRAKVRNATGGSLAAADIVAFAGTYSDGTDSYPLVVKADSAAPGSWIPAWGIMEDAPADDADGSAAQDYELSGINTSGQALHAPVYLSATAGAYTFTAPASGNVIQIIGKVTNVSASEGRVIFSFPGIVVPYSFLNQVENVTRDVALTSDVTIYDDQNNADTSLTMGTSAAESLSIQVLNGSSNKTAEEIKFVTATASGTANHGKMTFNVDGTDIGTIDDGGIDLVSGKTFSINGTDLPTPATAVTFDGSTANGVCTFKDANEATVESNLTFNGSILAVTGSVTATTFTGNIDAVDGDFDGTLEADAITLGGTALGSLYSPIAGSSSIATVGTIGTGTWQGTKVASAYLDDDTAHLSGTQTFSGAKTFSGVANVATATNWQLAGTAYTGSMANLNTLTDNSMSDALHRHSELSASDGTPDASVTVDSAGNVGIGATTPAGKLEIAAGAEIGLALSNADQSTMGATPHIWLGSVSAVGNLAQIAYGYDNSHTFGVNPPAVSGYIATSASGFTMGDLFFATRSATTNTAPTERMRITSAGNVGIGTASPPNLLSLEGSSPAIRITSTDATDALFLFNVNSGTAPLWGLIGFDQSEDKIKIVHSSSITSTDGITIDNAGNVGIGTAAPLDILHVENTSATPTLRIATAAAGDAQIGFYQTTTERAKIEFLDTSNVLFLNSLGNVGLGVGGTEYFRVGGSGLCNINETVNTNMTTGLTINQGANDDEILAFKSSAVTHPVTDKTEANTYGTFKKSGGTGGGLRISGFSDTNATTGNAALFLEAFAGDTALDTTKSTAGLGAILLRAAITDGGTDDAIPGANENLMVLQGLTTTRYIWDVEGSAHADVEWTTYDSHDDIQMVRDIEAVMVPEVFGESVKYREDDLVKYGLFGKGSIRKEPNGKMRGMMNTTKMTMLHHGTLAKLADRMETMQLQLNEANDKLARLEMN
jgi:hypothetical protein